MEKTKVCVIIPCLNAAASIGSILEKLKRLSIDTLIIDDGSSDSTAEIAGSHDVAVIKNKKNLGKGASLREGFRHASIRKYEAIITMDGDGQHLPEDIDGFLKMHQLHPEADIIIGNRMNDPAGMPFIRRITNRIMSAFISRLTHHDIPDSQNGFRLIKMSLIEALSLKSNRFEIESEIIIRASGCGARIISIPIKSVYKDAPSSISPLSDTVRFLRFILPYAIGQGGPRRKQPPLRAT